MIPQKLTLENFMPYGPQAMTLDLSGIHLACLAGENGHGKSAIIDAITWALWGKARARRDDELIHLGQEQMSVTFEFLLADTRYRVIRQRSSSGRGNSALEFQIVDDGQARPLTGDTLRETEQIIIDTIRMDYGTFINSALLLQGRADEFTNQPPGERKRILGEILGLSLYDQLEEKAKEHAKSAELELARIQAGAAQIEEELQRKPDYEAELREFEGQVVRYGQELKEAQAELDRLQEKSTEGSLKRQALDDLETEGRKRTQELQEIQNRIAQMDPTEIEKYQGALRDIEGHLESLDGLEEKRQAADHALRGLAEQKTSRTAINEKLREDMDALKEEIGLLERAEARCPLCDSDLSEEDRIEILTAKDAAGRSMAARYRENKTAIDEHERDLAGWQRDLSDLERQMQNEKSLQARKAEVLARLARLESEAERIGEWRQQADGLEETIADLSGRRDAVRAELQDLQEIEEALQSARSLRDQADGYLSQARVRLGAAQQKLDHCEYLEKQRQEKQDQHDQAGRQKAIYEELRLAFGKRGIQAMIIETVLPEIEEEANRLLEQMTDGRMHLGFESQRETKKGDLMETLDIHVSDELGSRSYDLFSGGEAFRINFAIRIAISKLLAQRAGARLQTLIIDEGFGSQDGRGRDRLVEAINSVSDDFALILVVTHIDELMGAFPNRIDVYKTPEGSQIAVN